MHANEGIDARFLLCRPNFCLDVAFTLPGKGLTVIQGASGSGKTTILRCIAGLERADEGSLTVLGQCWQDARTFLPAYRRPIGYVFQEDSLFDHLTVQGNIVFGCKDRSRIPASLQPLIDTLGITHLLHRWPADLSGGERQRVAIARAMAVAPMLLLMDEPLSSLDPERKLEILPYIEQIRDTHKIPILYVTHDVEEAARLATHMIRLQSGRIIAE